jgi:hypothetical protein
VNNGRPLERRPFMDIDTARARELLNQRDQIDAELAALFAGTITKKPIKCGHCQEEGHTARKCPRKCSPEG